MRHPLGSTRLLIAISFALTCASCARNAGRLPTGIALAEAQHVEVRDAGGRVVLSGEFNLGKAYLLSLDGRAQGMALIEIQNVGSDLEQGLHVAVEHLAPSAGYKLVVDAREVADFMTSGHGQRALKFIRVDPT